MNREELERKIAEASEDRLSPAEITALENELIKWPELQKDYLAIMSLPDIGQAYPVAEGRHHSQQIDHLLGLITKQNRENDQFTELSLHLFKKYALAASILIIAGSSALFMSDAPDGNTQESLAVDELFTYQAESTASDNYMVQIDNLLLDENSDE